MANEVLDPTPEDTAVCNALDPPVRGVNVGGGIHVVIPDDFVDRIAKGEKVPGCVYHAPQLRDTGAVDKDGNPILETVLFVSNVAAAKVADPTEIAKLDPKQQTDANALATKLTVIGPVKDPSPKNAVK